MKFALISHLLPPSASGQAIILYRLLSGFNSDDYCLLSNYPYDGEVPLGTSTQRLPCKYFKLPPAFEIKRPSRFGLIYLREGLNLLVSIVRQSRIIADIIRREKCKAVVACTGDVTLLPAGYLASRLTGLPFYAYIFDHYSYREWVNVGTRYWARRLEKMLLKGAAGVIVTNEMLRDDLRERFAVEATVIHNSCEIADYESHDSASARSNGEVKIVYTGDIYEAHYDAFHTLLEALKLLGRPEVKLHLYTSRSPEELARRGIIGSVVLHPPCLLSEMPPIQRDADLLFLPLAFDSPYPDLVRSSAPGKLGEYLVTRRPVLAHAPTDSFVAWYLGKYECGVVIDQRDPVLLAGKIAEVLDNRQLQETIGERAWKRAFKDFNIMTARAKFLDVLGSDSSKRGTNEL
jgi:glycosyltransferase involved in cell wall biosynthesis